MKLNLFFIACLLTVLTIPVIGQTLDLLIKENSELVTSKLGALIGRVRRRIMGLSDPVVCAALRPPATLSTPSG